MLLVILFALMPIVSIPAHADTLPFSFYIGPQPNTIPVVDNEAVGPYPGQLTDTASNPDEISSIGQYFCLDQNLTTYWGSTIEGDVIHPSTAADDEAAFLASLLLYDAAQANVTLNSYATPNADPATAFMNAVSGPVTFAIWQIEQTMPAGTVEPAGTQAYVDYAQWVYTNVFNNPGSADYAAGQAFLSSVEIFVPGAGYTTNQRFLMAVADSAFVSSVPEPGTLALLAGGLALAALGRKRFGRR